MTPPRPGTDPVGDLRTLTELVRLYPAQASLLAGVFTGGQVRATYIEGGVRVNLQVSDRPLAEPVHQLPLRPRACTGRDHELRELDRFLARAVDPLLILISGPAAAGKTTLAVEWLHRIGGRFHGRFFADLGANRDPQPEGEPLAGWLRTAGLPSRDIPAGAAERAAMWRTVTAGIPVVVLADDAGTAGQVRCLLPGSGPSVLVATSRRPLPGLVLHGACLLPLVPVPAEMDP